MTIFKYFSFQALVGQLVTLPRLLKDDKRYTVTVETVSSEKFHSQKRATSHFRADEYYKYLEITISKQVSITILNLHTIVLPATSYKSLFWRLNKCTEKL